MMDKFKVFGDWLQNEVDIARDRLGDTPQNNWRRAQFEAYSEVLKEWEKSITPPSYYYICDTNGKKMRAGQDDEIIYVGLDDAKSTIAYYFDHGYGDRFGLVSGSTGDVFEWVEREAE